MCATIAALAAVGVFTTSCVKRNLYVKPDEGRVELELNWQQIPSGESAPGQMSVYFYGANGSLTRGISQNNRSSAVLPIGQYKVLVFNENVEGVGFTDLEDYDKAHAYALPLNRKADGEELWIREPGWLYSANVGELTISTGDTVRQVLVPKPLVQRVTLNIRLTGDYQAVTSVSAALTGIAPAVRLATGLCSDGYASVTELDPKPLEGGGYTAHVLVFGVSTTNSDGTPASNAIRLGLNFSNGGSQAIEEDISGGGMDDPTNIEINIDIDIEVAATSEAGFTARVTKWEVTNGDMNVDNRPGGQPLPDYGN